MYIQQVASDQFVLLKADWPVDMAHQLVEMMDTSHVIVHRDQPEDFYYLYTRMEALDRLSAFGRAASVMEAFDLHESDATDTRDAFSDAELAPDRTIVLDEGRLMGFFDVTVPPKGGSTRRSGGPERGFAEPVPRSLQADFPEQVPMDETASLLVSLTAEMSHPTDLPLALPVGSQVDIVIQPQKGFLLEGNGEGSLTITDQGEPLPLQFRLKAVELGAGRIRVLAFHAGNPLGALVLAPSVVASGDVDATGPRRTHEERVENVEVAQQPDLQLLIIDARSGSKPAFNILLTAADPAIGLHFKPFGPVELLMDPLEYFNDFFKDIEDLPLSTPDERGFAEARLSAKGLRLFDSLFPGDLKILLWELKDRITTVEVDSLEPWIPWELCKLEGKENGDIVEGPFLCEAYAITRWIPGIGNRKPSLSLRNIGLVVPADSGLPFAQTERNYLLSLGDGDRRVTPVSARFQDVRGALASGEYDGWHFTGHGLFSDRDPNRSGIQLEAGFSFTPDELSGAVKNLGKAEPVVFLNACQIGRSALSLTDIGGFASQFLRAGASAFIGSYWSIFDEPAVHFARAFYDGLIEGDSISQSAKKARGKIRRGGDPTWLAYTVYAHPSAMIE